MLTHATDEASAFSDSFVGVMLSGIVGSLAGALIGATVTVWLLRTTLAHERTLVSEQRDQAEADQHEAETRRLMQELATACVRAYAEMFPWPSDDRGPRWHRHAVLSVVNRLRGRVKDKSIDFAMMDAAIGLQTNGSAFDASSPPNRRQFEQWDLRMSIRALQLGAEDYLTTGGKVFEIPADGAPDAGLIQHPAAQQLENEGDPRPTL